MGAGRNTETIPLQERVQRNPTVDCGEPARNLRKNELGAVIFGCTSYTIQECLPAMHFSYVKNIKPGMPLFLFNYSARQLFGVRICIRKECKPLLEYQYRPILEDNYYTDDQFWFELDHAQTGRLISKFESSPLVVSKYSWSAPKQRRASKNKKFKREDPWENFADSSNWNVLQDKNSDPGENKGKDFGSSDSKHATPWDERTDCVLGSPSATPCEDENNQNLEPDSDEVEKENEEELVYRKLLQLDNEREKANCDSMGDKENVGLLCDSNGSNGVQYFDCEPEVPQFNSEKHEMVSTNSSDAHFFSPTSSDVQSIVNQLRQEIEEVKVQQHQQTSQLEMKLTKAEIQVQQLTERIKELELLPIPSTASVKCLETRSADTMDMEEFPGDSKMVYFFGGYDGAAWLSTTDCYSPLTDTKKPLRPMISSRSYAAAAALCGDIYVFGGGDGTLWFNTVESYNPQRNEWTACPSLTHKKGCLSGVTLGSKIYAIGGGDGVNCFSDVEMFDPAAGRWICTQSMLQKRFSCAAAELNGAIYASGGYDGKDYLKSVERFDPREVVSWSSIPSMNVRRGCHSLVAMNGKLYALGGYNGLNMVSSVEEFDPRNNSWVRGDKMTEARGYSTAAVIGESIYVISGLKDGKVLTETVFDSLPCLQSIFPQVPRHVCQLKSLLCRMNQFQVECYKEGQGWSVANVKGAGKRCFFSSIVM
ncbi:hypothetical protein MKW94_016027 [Papaver nudicaule]|uniref:DCD domain-containing protein n=1 Tax=Papaver nudicaule TaxID=74823 RepID=A0AA42B1P7_PAPNU|nr:hypothetical protein [Papaver nudicaule]